MQSNLFGFGRAKKILGNKHKTLFLNIFSNPYLLSLFIALIIIITLPQLFNKYSAKVVSVSKDIKNQRIYYADLDNDGVSEKIIMDNNYSDKLGLRVFKNDELIEQWNFDGKWIENNGPFCCDIDGDGKKELFIFTYQDNKIFLNCLSPLKNKILVKNKIVTKYFPAGKDVGVYVLPCGFFDINKDEPKVYYFVISAGFSHYPRKLFAYDIAKDTLLQSGENCADIVKIKADKNAGLPNFITATEAVGNFKEKDTLSDMYSWLMDFDTNLNFKFPPIKIGYYPSHSDITNFTAENANYYVVTNTYFGVEGYPSTISLYNSELKSVKVKNIKNETQDRVGVHLYYDNELKPNYFFLMKESGNIEKLNSNLDVIDSIKFPTISSDYYSLNLDNDKSDEIIYLTDDLQNLIIAKNDFSNYVSVNCSGSGNINNCSVKLNANASPELFVQFENAAYTIEYGSNPLYYLKYPLYAGIYLCIFLLILLIQKAQKHRVELKYNTEKKIAELQMRSIKNQMDPHFTLNIINAIGSLFYKRDNKRADYVFGKYSKLLRTMVTNSVKIITTLSEELEYVKDFLDLELFRYDNKFIYEVKIEEGVNLNLDIPKMLVHTFAENAIKHGLRHLEKDGKLLIRVYPLNGNFNILIRDNGIGREEAKKIELDNTSKGLGILQQILDLYYLLMNKKIVYTIKDIVDDNKKAGGTEVLIEIPNN